VDASDRPARPREQTFLRAGVLLVSVFAATALVEASLRIFRVFPHNPPWYVGDHEPASATPGQGAIDPVLGWRMRPHADVLDESPEFTVRYVCNAQGFRSPHDFGLEEGEEQIAFLGDSFTFGVGVEYEETFVALVERALAGPRCLDFGMAGFGIDQMWRTLRELALPLAPELVVLAFVQDDLERSASAFRYRNGWMLKPTYVLEGGELAPMTRENRPNAGWRWCEQQLYLADLGRKIERRLVRSFAVGYRWRLNRALFQALRDDCRAAGIPLVVVHIPERGQWRPVESYAREFAELEIPFLDLGAVASPDPARLYYAKDPHLTAAGHRALAEALLGFLRERALVHGELGPGRGDERGTGR